MGHRLVTAIVGPLEEQGEESDFEFYPIIGLRILPDGTGDRPQVAELYRKHVDTTVRKASDGSPYIFSGPATITFGQSEQDPLYKLPVRRIINGMYVEFGTTNQYTGEVVKDYLA